MPGDCVVDEIADGIYRISTHLAGAPVPGGLSVNQFLVLADEPLLFHTGLRSMYPEVSAAVHRVVPLDRLRWLSFGHVEADECGSMNRFAARLPNLQVCFGAIGCLVSVDDLADADTRPLADGGVLDLGGRRLRQVPTPHAPHNWEAQVLYEEVTQTLLCGDLASQLGAGPPLTSDVSLLEGALAADAVLGSATPGPAVPFALRRLAALEPQTLAVMHGSSFAGDGGAFLRSLAAAWGGHLHRGVA
jgi:glyoxylase-like metal-dependent hydrolase (beta-lactamase superfamily II)